VTHNYALTTFALLSQGTGWQVKTDFVYTQPQGDWTEITFDPEEDYVTYINFLLTMTQKNLEVWKKLSLLILETSKWHLTEKKHDVMKRLELIDPTFTPPELNLDCVWQRELLDELLYKYSARVIATCYSTRRLIKYFFRTQATLQG